MESSPTVVRTIRKAFIDFEGAPGVAMAFAVGCEPSTEFHFALVDRAEGHFTLVIDLEWAEAAIDLRRHDSGFPGDTDLPAAALHAVVDGWPEEWAHLDPEMFECHRDDTGVARLGFRVTRPV